MLSVISDIYASIPEPGISGIMDEATIQSIASFQNANMSKVIGPTPGLVTHERPALFKTLTVEEYFKVFFSNELKGKSCLDVMRI
jgi:hypothetical protein